MHIEQAPSPNWDERPDGFTVDTVIIHYTGMQTAKEALDRLCNPAAKVSAHYLITEEGQIFSLVNENKRAWHAGVSHWRGRDNINHNSIGIELVNPGHEWGYRQFTQSQIVSLLGLLSEICDRHNIMNFVGHSDVAPDRKQDPGELFPWSLLAAKGFGFWSKKDGSDTAILLSENAAGPQLDYLNKQLGAVGYYVPNSLKYDANLATIVSAFQAHWRPENVTGVYDKGTALILDDIADMTVQSGSDL